MTQTKNWPLSKGQWTRQNIREEYRLARGLLEQAARDQDAVLSKPLSDIVLQMENALTPDQFSLERDDFSEVSESVYQDILRKVREWETSK